MDLDAKRLPVGSVVANDRQAWLKVEMDLGLSNNWKCTNGAVYSDYEISEYVNEQLFANLDGPVRVLRTGTDNPIF